MGTTERTWPREGDRLVHRFRKRLGSMEATVLSVDRVTGRIRLEVNGVEYSSLSSAAKAVSGCETNGWIFWGLRKQEWRAGRRD